jgi:NTE family protein
MNVARDSRQHFYSYSASDSPDRSKSASYEGTGVTLALGGGFSRGFAHLGVMEILEQARIPIAGIVGTSIGGLLGAAYADGIPVRVLCDLGRHVRVRDFLRFHKSAQTKHGDPGQESLQKRDYISQFVEECFRARRLEDLPIPTAIVATNLRTGAPYVFVRGPIETAIRATCAFPGLVKPVEYDGQHLVDGCLAAPVPTEIAARFSGGCVLGISVGASVASPENTENDLVKVFDAEFRSSHSRDPEPSWSRHADILLEPQVRHIDWNDFSRVQEAFDAGAEAMHRALPSLRGMIARRSEFTQTSAEPAPAESDLAR